MNKDEKRQFKSEVKETQYMALYVGVRVLAAIIILSIIFLFVGIGIKKIKVNADRNIFKQSVTYNENAGQFLADQFRQYNQTDEETEQKAIMNYVVMRYPNLDENKIESNQLRSFYIRCMKGN
jgi:hypothetical protein